MNRKKLYAAWGTMYILSAGLGFIHNPNGLMKAIMVMLMVAHFVPGFLLLYKGDPRDRQLVRNLSIASLAATLVVLVANVLSIRCSEAVGNVLYSILVIVSAPMVCGQYWAISMFFWACLMITAITKKKK